MRRRSESLTRDGAGIEDLRQVESSRVPSTVRKVTFPSAYNGRRTTPLFRRLPTDTGRKSRSVLPAIDHFRFVGHDCGVFADGVYARVHKLQFRLSQ